VAYRAALSALWASYRFNLRLRGSLFRRLSYNTARWAIYLRMRYIRPRCDSLEASAASLRELGARGANFRLVGVTLPDGLRLTLDMFTAQLILKEILEDGIYYAEAGFHPRAGDVVFDIGAQQGVYAALAARAGATVICAEPEPRNFGLLRDNLERNGLTGKLFDAAISDAEGEGVLLRSPDNSGGHSLHAAAGLSDGAKVRRITLETLARQAGCEPTLLKIDVEGHVLAVLRSGLALLGRCRPRIVLELDEAADEDKISALLTPLGYSVSRRGNNIFARPLPRP
jgi:FkbM family methyltransferase